MQKRMLGRREALAAGLVVACAGGAAGQAQSKEIRETQMGDPQQEAQVLVVDKATLDKIESLLSIAAFNIAKDARQVALRALTVAEEYVGKNQGQNPEMVEELFRVLGMEPRDGAKQLLPFCAAGVSYCTARAYCDYEVPEVIAYIPMASANKPMFASATGSRGLAWY